MQRIKYVTISIVPEGPTIGETREDRGSVVKHASAAALNKLEDVLDDLRSRGGLRERKRGVFYRGASAFLHFHEDPAGLFADMRTASGWERFPLNTRDQKRILVRKVDETLRATK
jgi:hypothetical protein